jgi:hypothetical protein
VSNDAIQDLIDECEYPPGDSHDQARAAVIARAQSQHTANRDVIASLRSSLEGRAAEVAQLHEQLRVTTRDYDQQCVAHQVTTEELEAALAKIARLESAIADHVIDEATK